MDRRKNPHSLAAIGLGRETAVFKDVSCSYSLYREAVRDADGGEKQREGRGGRRHGIVELASLDWHTHSTMIDKLSWAMYPTSSSFSYCHLIVNMNSQNFL